MFLYRFAMVLMVLRSEAQKMPEYSKVIPIVESYVFPATPTPQGIALVTRVKNAMKDISGLVSGADRPTILELMTQQEDLKRGVNQAPEFSFSWAWLHDIGIDEHNPATLILFATWWTNSFIMIVKIVRDLKPV